MGWYKKSSWDYVQAVLHNLSNSVNLLQNCKSPGCKTVRNELIGSYNELNSLLGGDMNDPVAVQAYQTSIRRANAALSTVEKTIPEVQQDMSVYRDLQNTRKQRSWYDWERASGTVSNIRYVESDDPSQPGLIYLDGLNFGYSLVDETLSETAQFIKSQMGDWLQHGFERERYPGASTSRLVYHTAIRGTREAWDMFASLSHLMFRDHEKIEKFRFKKDVGLTGGNLPSENAFDPDFQPKEGYGSKPKQGERRRVFVYALNPEIYPSDIADYESQISYVPYQQKTPLTQMPGIRLAFEDEDKNFPFIQDKVLKFLKKDIAPFDPSQVRVDQSAHIIDIYESGPAAGTKKDEEGRFIDPAKKWYSLGQWLQNQGYMVIDASGADQGVKPLYGLIESLTGKKPGKIKERLREERSKELLSPKAVYGRLRRNLDGAKPGNETVEVGSAHGELPPMNQDQFIEWVGQQYPNAFNPEFVTPQQAQSQKEGMFFAASREVSIIADEPGSGKTSQAIVAMDMLRNEGQKILVITPNELVQENWIPDYNDPRTQVRGPNFFTGHDQPGQVQQVKNAEQLARAINDPNCVWVVIPDKTWRTEERGPISEMVSQYSMDSAFSGLIIDEIQTLKNLDGKSFKALQDAIGFSGKRRPEDIAQGWGESYGIPHRVGMTGTPADNDPSDIYSQIILLRHPLLYRDKGWRNRSDKTREWNIDVTLNGFLENFLGGQEAAEYITHSAKEKKRMSKREQEILTSSNQFNAAMSVLRWASTLSDDNKMMILDTFSTTFLRRNKSDIREDVVPKNQNTHTVPNDGTIPDPGSELNWHVRLVREMAFKKIPYTVDRAVAILTDPKLPPDQKVFIVTGYPDVAHEISEQINAQLGDGTSSYVSGNKGSKDQMSPAQFAKRREIMPGIFKQPNGMLPGAQQPLRAVIYTMGTGAVGLNFQVANKAIFNDIAWNPSLNLQAEFRVHRINSPRPVDIDYMVIENSYDQEMYNRVMRKQLVNCNATEVMRSANKPLSPEQRLALANDFLRFMVDNVLFDIELTPEQQSQIEGEKEKVLGAPSGLIDPYECMSVQSQQPAQVGMPREVAANWYDRLSLSA